jgi:DNA-3-methyladenine glycosylase
LLERSFYARDVHTVARELIGCSLTVDGMGGVIVETEAYNADDPACHAYRGPTERNAPLYERPGHAYVYLNYGIHSLLNAVAEPEGEPAAVLIRALEPGWGIEKMIRRRGVERLDQLCSGPGKLTQALGVGLHHNRAPLDREPFELGPAAGPLEVIAGPRIGISVGTDLPWRYCAAGSGFVSRPWPAAERAAQA